MIKILIGFFCLILWAFFSFRLLEVPPGITVDEAAFGYNAALISKTLKDEYDSEGYAAKFFEKAYFKEPFTLWAHTETIPSDALLLTNSEFLDKTEKIKATLPVYNLHRGL